MKRISITHSKHLEELLSENIPPQGAVEALQYGANFWMYICKSCVQARKDFDERMFEKDFEPEHLQNIRRVTLSYRAVMLNEDKKIFNIVLDINIYIIGRKSPLITKKLVFDSKLGRRQ